MSSTENPVDAAAHLFGQFKAHLDENNISKCKEILPQLKLLMIQFPSLSPLNQSPSQAAAAREHLLARTILEQATLMSAQDSQSGDTTSFQRHVQQLKTYYHDSKRYPIPPSELQYPILGLNLLHLLATNNLSEFHTELELIPIEHHKNVFIKHPIQLEQYLMEGAYMKLLSSRADVPAPTYTHFMDILMKTVRDEISDCCEKSYRSLLLPSLQKLLSFNSLDELQNYLNQRMQSNWEIKGNQILFHSEDKKGKAEKEIPSMKLIHQTLTYAKELERIV